MLFKTCQPEHFRPHWIACHKIKFKPVSQHQTENCSKLTWMTSSGTSLGRSLYWVTFLFWPNIWCHISFSLDSAVIFTVKYLWNIAGRSRNVPLKSILFTPSGSGGSGGGALGTHAPLVQFLSFPYSFQQKICQIISWWLPQTSGSAR